MLDLLYSLSWGWVNGGKGPSFETTIYLMLGFSPRYYCTIWKEIWRICQLGTISWKGCSANEWYSPNTLHSRTDANLDWFEGLDLERSLEDYPKVFCSLVMVFSSYMHCWKYLSMLYVLEYWYLWERIINSLLSWFLLLHALLEILSMLFVWNIWFLWEGIIRISKFSSEWWIDIKLLTVNSSTLLIFLMEFFLWLMGIRLSRDEVTGYFQIIPAFSVTVLLLFLLFRLMKFCVQILSWCILFSKGELP